MKKIVLTLLSMAVLGNILAEGLIEIHEGNITSITNMGNNNDDAFIIGVRENSIIDTLTNELKEKYLVFYRSNFSSADDFVKSYKTALFAFKNRFNVLIESQYVDEYTPRNGPNFILVTKL